MKRILIVDDHPLMRKGLALSLEAEPDLTVCGQVADAEEALRVIEELAPDLAIVDISLPGMSGIELTKHLRALQPKLAILIVSRHDEALYAERALRAGARGYVMKLEAGEVLVKAVRRVVDGGLYLSEGITEQLFVSRVARGERFTLSPLEVLSDRELEVLEHLGHARSTREIAGRLHVAVKTVESYRARIQDKLNLTSGRSLVQLAVRWVEGEREAGA